MLAWYLAAENFIAVVIPVEEFLLDVKELNLARQFCKGVLTRQ